MSLLLMIAAAASPQSVFGIQIGQPLAIPECKKTPRIASLPDVDFGYEMRQPVVCHQAARVNAGETWATETIVFPLESMPTIARSGKMDAMIVDGKVIGFTIPTAGIESQEVVISLLTEKYGKPASVTRSSVQNSVGGSFQAISAIWATAGLAISFNAAPYRLDIGEVMIDTPAALALRTAALSRANAAHTPL